MVNKKLEVGKAMAAITLTGVAVVSALTSGLITAANVEPEVQIVTETITLPGETITETIEVEVPVNVTVVETVEVEDIAFKALACDRLLFDDIEECHEEVEAEDVALRLAILEIEDNYADELEDANIVKDEDDVRIVKIYSDFEDVEVVKSNFDNERYVFNIDVKIDDDDDKSRVTFKVEVEDGKSDILSITE